MGDGRNPNDLFNAPPAYQVGGAPQPQQTQQQPLNGGVSYQSPYADRNPAQPLQNAMKDATSFGQTFAGMWNLGQLRAREATIGDTPLKVPSPYKVDTWIDSALGSTVLGAVFRGNPSRGQRPLIRPAEDARDFSNALGDAASYYRGEYKDTFAQPDLLPRMAKGFAQAPLARMLDLGGFGIAGAAMKPLGKLGGAIGNLPKVQPVTKALGNARNYVVGGIANRLPEGLVLGFTPEWVKALTPAGQAQAYVINAMKDIDLDRLEEVMAAKKELDTAFADLHKEMNPRTFAAGVEFTDREARKVITQAMAGETYGSPTIQRAVNAIRKYNAKMTKALQIPDDVLLRQQYGGQYISVINRLRKASIQKLAAELKELDRVQSYRTPGKATPSPGMITKEKLPHPKLPDETYDRVRIAGRPPFKEEMKRFLGKSDAEIQARRDYIRAAMKDNRLLTFEDLNDNGPHFAQLMKMAQRMEKIGAEKPTYVPIVTAKSAAANEARTFNEPFGGISGGVSKTEKLAKDVGRGKYAGPFDAPESERPGFMQERAQATSTPQPINPANRNGPQQQSIRIPERRNAQTGEYRPFHEMRTQKATLDRVYRTAQFVALQKYFRLLLDMKVEAKSHWVDINLRDELAAAAKATGASSRAVEDTFKKFKGADTISVPPQVAAVIKRNLLRQPGGNNIFRRAGSFFNKWLFGADPSFGPRLFMQTAAVQGISLKSPKDFAAMVIAYTVAADPEAEKLFPPAVILSSKHTLQDSLLKIKDPKLARAEQGFLDRMIQKKTDIDYQMHDYQRRAFAIHYLLYRAENAPPSVRALIADFINYDGLLEKAAGKSYAELPALQAHIKKYLGDYSALTAAERQALRDLFPIAQWMYHARDLLFSVPVENPAKLSAINALQGFVKRYQDDEQDDFSKKRGQVKMTNAQGETMRGPNQGAKYYGGYNLDPLESGFALTKDLGELLFNVGGEIEFPGGINPINTATVGFGFGIDPRTRKPYRNYDLAKDAAGNQYNPKTGERVERPTPDFLTVMAEEFLPKQEAAAQRLKGIVSGTMPSRFTTPFNAAPKRDAHGNPLKLDAVEAWLQMVGLGATEMTISPQDRYHIQRYQQRRGENAVRRFNQNR